MGRLGSGLAFRFRRAIGPLFFRRYYTQAGPPIHDRMGILSYDTTQSDLVSALGALDTESEDHSVRRRLSPPPEEGHGTAVLKRNIVVQVQWRAAAGIVLAEAAHGGVVRSRAAHV